MTYFFSIANPVTFSYAKILSLHITEGSISLRFTASINYPPIFLYTYTYTFIYNCAHHLIDRLSQKNENIEIKKATKQ